MNLFFHKDEVVDEKGLNVRSFINDTYCTITKAVQEKMHDHFIIQHSWEILNFSLLAFFDDKNKSKSIIKMKTKNSIPQNSQSNESDSKGSNDEILLSTSAKSFAVLSHASNVVVQSLTNKKYFYRLATEFLRKQNEKKNAHIYSSENSICKTTDSESDNNEDLHLSSNQFYSSAPASRPALNATINCDSTEITDNSDAKDDDESNWLLPPEIVISRLASIFQNIINQDTDHLKDSAQLLLLFIPFVNNSGVFDLLSSSFSLEALKPNLFHHLIRDGLVNEIIKNISIFKFENKKVSQNTGSIQKLEKLNIDQDNFYSIYSINISNYFNILNFIARNKYLIKSLNESNQLFSILSQFASMNNLEAYIKNSLWRAISSVCNENSIKKHQMFLKVLFYKAMKIISEPYVVLHIYHTYAMDFLGKIIKIEPKFFIENELLMFESIIEVISRLIAQFPDSTHLQSSIARFILASIDHSNSSIAHFFTSFTASSSNSYGTIITSRIIKNLFPLIIMTAQSKHYRSAASANCVCVMYHVSLMRSSNSMISQFCNSSHLYKDFMAKFMNDYVVKLGSSYGGGIDEQDTSLVDVNKISNEVKLNQNQPIIV